MLRNQELAYLCPNPYTFLCFLLFHRLKWILNYFWGGSMLPSVFREGRRRHVGHFQGSETGAVGLVQKEMWELGLSPKPAVQRLDPQKGT